MLSDSNHNHFKTENISSLNNWILCKFLISEPYEFVEVKEKLAVQLVMMPENEKYALKQEILIEKENNYRIKELGRHLLERCFVH